MTWVLSYSSTSSQVGLEGQISTQGSINGPDPSLSNIIPLLSPLLPTPPSALSEQQSLAAMTDPKITQSTMLQR